MLVPAGNPSIGGQAYMFLHRTIAEYLTARHLRDLTPAKRMRQVAEHQWFDPDWAEVLPMLGALLTTDKPAEAKALVTHFLSQWPDPQHRAFCTAIRILGEQPDPDHLLGPSQAHHFTDRAISLLEQDLTRARWPACWPRRLAGPGRSPAQYSPSRKTTTSTYGPRPPARWPTARTQVLPRPCSPFCTTQTGGCGLRPPARWPAARTRPSPETLLTLLRDPDTDMRAAAADALASHQDMATTQALLTLLRDPDSSVRG